jgi:maleylpyruvate isomerase
LPVTVDPLGFAAEIARADDRLRATMATLDEAALRAPSLLPGWTRGHVLTHIARNADGYVNLLTWARTGVETPMYPSFEKRGEDIEKGAGRPLAEQVADVDAAAERFAAAVRAMTPEAWGNPVRHLTGREMWPPQLIWGRLREIEVHHVDLGAGYGPADWDESFTLHLLREVAGDLGPGALKVTADDLHFTAEVGGMTPPVPAEEGAATTPVEVRGPARALAAWLIGRSTGDGLSRVDGGPLPDVPTWK